HGTIVRDQVGGTDVLASGILEFPAGIATFTCSTRLEDDQRVHIYGTKGRITIPIPFNIPPDRPTEIQLLAVGDPLLAPAIHVLGQVALHFRVSVPQILAAILACAVIEIAMTFRQKRAFVWPASAMLTGSGVALILRVVGTPPDQPWNTDFWWLFAIVAGLS